MKQTLNTMNIPLKIAILLLTLSQLGFFAQKPTQKNNNCSQVGTLGTLNFDELNFLTSQYENIKYRMNVNNQIVKKTGWTEFDNLLHATQSALKNLKCALNQTGSKDFISDREGIFNNKEVQHKYNLFVEQNAYDKKEQLISFVVEYEKVIFELKQFETKIKNPTIKKLNKYLMCISQNSFRNNIQHLKKLNYIYKPHFLYSKEFEKMLSKKKHSCTMSASSPVGNQQGRGNGQGKGSGQGKGMGKGQGKF